MTTDPALGTASAPTPAGGSAPTRGSAAAGAGDPAPAATAPWTPDETAPLVTGQHVEEQAIAADVDPHAESDAAIVRRFGPPQRTIALVLIGALGGYVMMLTLATALSARLTALDAQAATGIYSRTTSLSALLMLVAIPLVGSLSDRTTSRLGRRRPWIIGGYLVALVCFLLIGAIDNGAVITIAYIIGATAAQAGFNAYSVIPVEGIPSKLRGRVMGVMGLCGALAMSAGAYLASALVVSPILLMTVPVLIGIVFVIPLLALYRDPQHTPAEVPQGNVLDMFRNFFVDPRKHPNFGWVWLARFLAGVAMAAFFGFFFLYLVVKLHHAPGEAAAMAGQLSLYSAPISILFFTGSGWISDKLGMRKPFVALAAVLMAVALLLAAFAPSFGVFTIAWLIFAMGQAMYLTVDLALCAEVLPNEADAGKDMAVFGLALNLPNVIVPALAPFLLGAASDNYTLLWGLSAAACLAGAFLMPLVKGVK